MIKFQKNSIWMATYNVITAELKMFEHIPKTEVVSNFQSKFGNKKEGLLPKHLTLMCKITFFIIHQIQKSDDEM